MKEISKVFDKEIVGQNVTLKKYDISYKDEFKDLAFQNRDYIFKYTHWSNPFKTEQDINTYFNNVYLSWADNVSSAYMILENSTGKLIGDTKMYYINYRFKSAETSIWLGQDFTGKGYAKEANLILTNNFMDKGFNIILASVNKDNQASKNILISNGYTEFNSKKLCEDILFQKTR